MPLPNDMSYRSAYAAAKLLDQGLSARAAAKQVPCNRRQALAIEEAAALEGMKSAKLRVVTWFLEEAATKKDGRDGERTTSEIAREMGAGSTDEIRSLMRLLQASGTVVNTREPSKENPDLPESAPPTASSPPRPEEDEDLLDPADWPGHRSSAVEQALHNMDVMTLVQEQMPGNTLPPRQEEVVLALILRPKCRRILLSQADTGRITLEYAEKAAPAPPWPWKDAIYLEHQESIERPDGRTYYGYIVIPGEEPRTILVVSSGDHLMELGTLNIDLTTCTATCKSEHEGQCSIELHTEQARWVFALAHFLSSTDTEFIPLPLSRQQRRAAERRNLPNPWLIIKQRA